MKLMMCIIGLALVAPLPAYANEHSDACERLYNSTIEHGAATREILKTEMDKMDKGGSRAGFDKALNDDDAFKDVVMAQMKKVQCDFNDPSW
jgi:hypothetical protein